MRKHKVTAFIPVQNVEDVIEECLKSVTWADEILIIDAFSTDKTIEICRKFSNVRILQHEYLNSASQRSWGMPQASHEWVFIIDSDEQCTPALHDEIEKILSIEKIPCNGYRVHLKTMFFGKLLKHDTHLGHWGKRLVKKDQTVKYAVRRVHSTMNISKMEWIKNKKAYIIHNPIRDFASQWRKMIRYATWAAEDMYERGKKAHWYNFILHPAHKFLFFFIIRRGFGDGIRGAIICSIAASAVFMKYFKLFELHNKQEIAIKQNGKF
jgi:glycosyltransferase involved in cell wall biosynthesis